MMKWIDPPVRYPLRPGETETFGDHALTGESRVAMDEERQHFRALDDIVQLILLGAHLAEHDGIDDLEMRRVRGQRKMDPVVVEVAVGRGAKMIFDVAGPFDVVGRKGAALEFVENRPVRLPHDLGQHIEAAAVRHAEDDVLDPQGAAALDDLFERRHHGFGAIKAKPLRAGIFHVEEFLETLRIRRASSGSARLPSLVKVISLSGPSIRCCSQLFSAGSEICMNSKPMVPQ